MERERFCWAFQATAPTEIIGCVDFSRASAWRSYVGTAGNGVEWNATDLHTIPGRNHFGEEYIYGIDKIRKH